MTAKRDARARIAAARSARPEEQRELDRAAIRAHILSELPHLLPVSPDRATSPTPGSGNIARSAGGGAAGDRSATGVRIAAYEPLRTEPGSVELLAALTEAGFEVLVPVTLPDRDLDWRPWPHGDALGPDAIGTASLVLVPAYAVDDRGHRLGRGGGSYDRALARARPGIPVLALLFAGEVLPEVPVDDWDLPVSGAITPAGRLDFTPDERRNSR